MAYGIFGADSIQYLYQCTLVNSVVWSNKGETLRKRKLPFIKTLTYNMYIMYPAKQFADALAK